MYPRAQKDTAIVFSADSGRLANDALPVSDSAMAPGAGQAIANATSGGAQDSIELTKNAVGGGDGMEKY